MKMIEELYEKLGIKKQLPKICSNYRKDCEGCCAYLEKEEEEYCSSMEYPSFTHAKKAQVMELIGSLNSLQLAFYNFCWEVMFHQYSQTDEFEYYCKGSTLEEALASLILKLIASKEFVGLEEKVKEILEDE